MKNFLLGNLLILLICLVLVSCGPSKEIANKDSIQFKDTVAVVGNDIIPLKEYEEFYIKNNGGPESILKATEDSKKQFLDLLVKYKLKVKEAYSLEYLKDPEVKKEVEEYKRSLAIPYIIEREITEPNLKMWYERRKTNLKVGAILLRTSWNNPEDTLVKYNLAVAIIDSLNKGVSFGLLAAHHSQLRMLPSDSGMLGYVSAAHALKEFEDEMYSLPIGQYSKKPVKLSAGYFILKVLDSEPRTGGKKIGHIMFTIKGGTMEDTLNTFKKSEEVYKKLKNGEDFAKLALDNSDDQDSRANGGLIGSFEREPSLSPKDFWNEAFKLKEGEFSAPIRTHLGIHIIKRMGTEPYPSYETYREKLKDDYKSLRYDGDYQNFISLQKSKFKQVYNLEVINQFYKLLDTNKTTSSPNWDSLLTADFKKKNMMAFGTKQYTVDDIVEMFKTHPELRNINLNPDGLKRGINKVSEILVLNLRADQIDSDYPDFKNVMKEYTDGLLLFKAEQNAVWSKINVNDSLLKVFFEKNRDQFTFPDRVDISEIQVQTDSLAYALFQKLTLDPVPDPKEAKSKKKKKTVLPVKPTFEELAAQYTIRDGYKEKKGRWGFLTESDNMLGKKGLDMSVGQISTPFTFENGISLIKVNAKDKARRKDFSECGPELSSKFQEFETKRLESEWISYLKNKFKVVTFDEKLRDAFKSKN